MPFSVPARGEAVPAGVDYDALASVRVDGLRVLDALGASLGLQDAGYTRILSSNASLGQIIMALRVGAQGNSTAVAALTSILNAMPNPGNLVPLTHSTPWPTRSRWHRGRACLGPRSR